MRSKRIFLLRFTLIAVLAAFVVSNICAAATKNNSSQPLLLAFANDVALRAGKLITPHNINYRIKKIKIDAPFDSKMINSPLQLLYWVDQMLEYGKFRPDRFSSDAEISSYVELVQGKFKAEDLLPVESWCSSRYDGKTQSYSVSLFTDRGLVLWSQEKPAGGYVAENMFGKKVPVQNVLNPCSPKFTLSPQAWPLIF